MQCPLGQLKTARGTRVLDNCMSAPGSTSDKTVRPVPSA